MKKIVKISQKIKPNGYDYFSIFNYVKNELLSDKETITLGSEYEIFCLNTFLIASNENIKSEYNLGEKIELVSEYYDPETDLISEDNPLQKIFDDLYADFLSVYNKIP